jgi:hypothetical protein
MRRISMKMKTLMKTLSDVYFYVNFNLSYSTLSVCAKQTLV